MPKQSKKPKNSTAPVREQLLAFIQARGGRVSKREIVRAFRLDAAGKAELNGVLRELGLTGGEMFAYKMTGGSNLDLPDLAVAVDGSERGG